MDNYYKGSIFNKTRQNYKSLIIILLMICHLTRFIIYAKFNKNGKLPDIYFDIIQYFGGHSIYYYVCFIITIILALGVSIILNSSKSLEKCLLNIINVFIGINSFCDIKIYAEESANKFTKRVKFANRIVYAVKNLQLFASLFYFILIIHKFSSIRLLTYGILSLFIQFLFAYYFLQFSLFLHCLRV